MAKKNRRSISKRSQSSSPEPLLLVQFEITDEPIEGRAFRKLPNSVKRELERLHWEAQRKPEQAIPELLEFKKKYPNIPQIYNYLTVAYSASKDMEKAEAIIEENIRRNPDYLFARVNYAEVCFARQEYEKIPEIFDHAYDLKALYPNRKRFHISEFANFMGIIGFYFAKTDQREMAERYNEMLQETAPDFPMAKRLNRELNPGILTRLLKRLANEPPVDPQP
jgi:tetratricopeptide (TPR) repeat protein